MRTNIVVSCARLFTAFVIIIYITYTRQTSNSVLTTLQTTTHNSTEKIVSKNIVIVVVVCPPANNDGPRDEATVLLKSILISAKLNKISTITIYFFVENISREKIYFRNKINKFGHLFSEFVLIMRFRSAVDAVPYKYRNEFINNTKLKQCTTVRLFIPNALPRMDSVLYLDTDIVVHGNLLDLWNTWDLMDEKQLIGIAPDYEEGSYFIEQYKDSIHPPPSYLNAGVLLMNLTRMRNFDWERKLATIWDEYNGRIPNINNQTVINIMLYFNQELLYRLPCHYNFMDQHCTLNATCKTAKTSRLQIIHGAGNHFVKANTIRHLYLVYRRFKMHNLLYYSNEKFRAVVHKSFNNFPYKKTICQRILSEIIK